MSLQKDILASMSDETLIDVHLVGTDGVEIPCSKFVLSARSEYFKKLFHSGCKEQYDDRSELDCPSEVIQTIVKYCYSDELDLDHIFDDAELTEQKVWMLVQLRNAAKRYLLERILRNVETRIGELVFQNKAGVEYACFILAATEEQDGAFWETLFQFVVMNPVECLHLDQGTIECDPRLLARVLDKVNDPYVVARSLYTWAVVQENENDAGCEDRDREILLSLAKRVDLKQLSTNQLSKIGHCLAFSKDQILEAYIHHGSLSQVQPPGLSSIPSRNVTIYVAGAGVPDVNGLYEQFDFCGQVFAKSGTYGGVQCRFELKWHPAKNGWKISVLPETIGSTCLHMYQATKISMNEAAEAKQIPFNHWTCLEGAEPAPYVARFEPAKHFTFGKSTMPTPPPQFSSTPPAPSQFARTQRRSRGRV